MGKWKDEWMDGWIFQRQRNMKDVVYYINIFGGTIINMLYASVMPLYIADTPISHFNKGPHNFIGIRSVMHVKSAK